MDREQVLDLMRSSRDRDEWNNNADAVKKACGGYPAYWFAEVVQSGLMDATLGAGASDITVSAGPAVVDLRPDFDSRLIAHARARTAAYENPKEE